MNHRTLAALLLPASSARKLLSLTCIASLLFALVSPAFAEQPPLGVSKTSWGMLKSRYGHEDVVERGGVYKAVVDAILQVNPLLTAGDIRYVGKVGPEGYGYVGVGILADTEPYVVFVNGNFTATRGFAFEYDEGSNTVEALDLMNNLAHAWSYTGESNSSFDRTHLQPSGFTRDEICDGVAATAGFFAGFVKAPKVVKGLLVGAVTVTVHYLCMRASIANIPDYTETQPCCPSENVYKDKPRPGGSQ